jgi:hypothetical protein
MKILKLGALVGLVACMAIGSAQAQTAVFGFESLGLVSVGMTTPLSNVAADNGSSLTASFSDANNNFVVGDNLDITAPPGQWSNLSNVILTQPVGTQSGFQTLNIDFSTPLTAVALDFGLFDPGDMTLTTNTGGSNTVSGVVDVGSGFPEGTISFSSSVPFSRISLSSTSEFFAIDDITVTAIPEPGVLVFALAALAPLALRLRRRS